MRPSKKQKTLPFSRTIITRQARETIVLDGNESSAGPSSSNPALALSPAPSSLASSLAPSLAPSSDQGTPDPPVRQRTETNRQSWIFRHMPDEDVQTLYFNEYTGKPEWRCRYCGKAYALSGSTSGPGGHLQDVHKLPKDSPRTAKAHNIKVSLQQAFAQATANPQKRRRPNTETIDQDQLESLWVRCLVSCNLSFRMIENTEFRAFLKYLNDDAEELMAKHHSTIRIWVIRQYKGLKLNTIIPILGKARSKIHISCDLWTSPNTMSILGITAQFVDESGKLRSLVLALKEINEHARTDLAKEIYDIICEYKIENNLGYFVMDNALDNDTMIMALAFTLRRELKIVYDATHHRIRCQVVFVCN